MIKKLVSSLASGIIISLLNTLFEYLSDIYQLYSIKGEPRFLSTPVYFLFMWIALASFYAFASFRLKGSRLYLYVLAGTLLGWLFDFLAWKAGILIIEDKGNFLINAFVWVFLVPLTILLARMFQKI